MKSGEGPADYASDGPGAGPFEPPEAVGEDVGPGSPWPLPRVNPVGIVEGGVSGGETRSYSRGQRSIALAFLLFFFVATVVTSALSIGAYCLSTQGSDTRALHASPVFSPDSD